MDARIVDKERKTATLLEMSCPWIENRIETEGRGENLQVRPTTIGNQEAVPKLQCKITQINIIMNVLGGCSKGLRD